MSHWITLPVVLPPLTATLLLIALRNDLRLQRIVSMGSTLALLAVAAGLFAASAQGPSAYLLGAWPAPFGIVLVLDRLSALMLLLAAVIAVAALAYAMMGWDERGRHFHVLFHFQMLGINGSFLTGDVFNLFVFFEVMLIASYGLVLHGGGAWRLKAGFQYIAINLVASTLFLFAVGLIYGVTGTLNMADLAVKVARVAEADQALLRVGALLLFGVFAVKCALVPLHWWLPATYSAAPAPAVALFAVLTKVGAYAVIRLHTLAFGGDAVGVSSALQTLLLPAAIVTLVIGAVGVLASRSVLDLAAYSIIASMGTLLIVAAGLDPGQLAAALYYILHSTLIGAGLFLLVDIVAASRGATADRIVPGIAIARPGLLAGFYLVAAMAMVGLPPLSGFIGKLAILDSLRTAPLAGAAWAAILGTSLLLIIGYARAGSTVFWKAGASATAGLRPARAGPLAVVAVLLAATAALSLMAGPVMAVLEATAHEVLTPSLYVRAVLPAVVSLGP